MSRSGRVPRVRPSLHRVGAPRAVRRAGGGRGGGLALVLRAAGVRAPRPGAHSAETEKYFSQISNIFPPLQTFSCPPSLPHLLEADS